MEQHAFDQMLGLADLPLCGACAVLLKHWAESDNRIGHGDEAWEAFQLHRSCCREQHMAEESVKYSYADRQPGKIFQVPSKLFLVAESAAANVPVLSGAQSETKTAA